MSPLVSLQHGRWFKLICGASFQHLPSVRTLAIAYTLAGADCIDVAADPAVIRIAREAIALAQSRMNNPDAAPWLMVSVNDGEDPHFRKAVFDPHRCPTDCPQPCIPLCPADAITPASLQNEGVIEERCYGCGRCLTICPMEQIEAISHQSDLEQLTPMLIQYHVEALEIHTQVGHEAQFLQLWKRIQPLLPHLKLLAISCPYEPGVIDYLQHLQDWITPLPCALLWQTDGRPMSGDIGDGTTRTTIKYAQLALASRLEGFIQVAGGTNGRTVEKLNALGLLMESEPQPSMPKSPLRGVAGIAYGSYARTLFDTLQSHLDAATYGSHKLEEVPTLLNTAVQLAIALVSPLKSHPRSPAADSSGQTLISMRDRHP